MSQMFGIFPYYSPCFLSYDTQNVFWLKKLVIFDTQLGAFQRNPVSWSCGVVSAKTQASLECVLLIVRKGR